MKKKNKVSEVVQKGQLSRISSTTHTHRQTVNKYGESVEQEPK